MMLQGLAVALLIGVDLIAGESTAVRPAGVVETYTVIAERQNGRLRGASMEVEIEASLPKLKKHGRLSALRRISDLGRITYEKIHFEGDKSIENEVIARYLAADARLKPAIPEPGRSRRRIIALSTKANGTTGGDRSMYFN